ncbi:transglycosylase domain-containing protein [Brevibacillus sp. SYSU BS000544]|uniref:transglycosylase domain-containing protein n=1 Tax=Brevibacillus sp. SYSU BS000544 TaxID=3416443 RepID=UPI003CE51CB2
MENEFTSSDKKAKRKRRRGKKNIALTILQLFLLFGFMGALLAGGAVAGYVAALVKDEPVRSYDEIQNKIFSNYLTGFAYFNDGSLIGQLRAEDGDRRLVKKSEVSPYLINAIIATEDKYFFEHNGIVFQSTLRGAFQDLTNAPVVTGGSTLTQQLIKNTILSPEVSHKRKAKEIFYALRIERMFSKDQILEAYMNEIYLGKNANGSNIYGVQAAAKGIFDKDVKDLNLSEASYIAGLIQNPGNYSPFSQVGYRRGKERQKMVLERMVENQYINQEQFDEAFNSDLKVVLAKPQKRAFDMHPYLMTEIEERAAQVLLDQQLQEEGRDKSTIGRNEYHQLIQDKSRQILRNGYHIYTTVNKDVDRIMQDIASNPKNFGKNISYNIKRANGKTERIENALEEVGGMLIHNKTGAILGMIGGRDFNVEQTNHATVPRQPGSAMKPLAAYGPAFELGILQPGSPIDDSPLTLADGVKGTHQPMNWDNKYHGMMSAREALRQSWNVPAIKTYLKVGIPTALEYVKKMGVTTLEDADNHAATGVIGGLTYGLTVEEITNAYATFANHGSFIDAYLIDRIEDSQGKVIYKHQVQPQPVFSEQTAYLITDMMRSVVNSGTGASIRKYVPRSIDVAGKTGTTNSSNDLWFVGYTPELSLGVWSGYDDPHPLASKTRPMDIWGKVMKEVLKLEPSLSPKTAAFDKPGGIISVTIDSKSGLLPSELSKEAGHLITDLFNKEFVPTKKDDTHQKVKVVEFNKVRYLAKAGTPDDFVTEGIFFKSPEPLNLTADDSTDKNKKSTARPPDWDQRLPEKEDPRTDVSGTPAVPGNVTLSKTNNQLTLGWASANEADLLGYRIYRAGTDGQFVKLTTVKDPSTLTLADTISGHAGYYVTSVDIAGNESAPSPIASTTMDVEWQTPTDPTNPPIDTGTIDPNQPTEPGGTDTQGPDSQVGNPSAPANLSINKVSTGLKLSWAENPDSEQVILYNVYYTSDPVNGFTLLDTVASTSYTHKTTKEDGWYYVTAVNSYGESVHSDNVSGLRAQ